MQSTLQGLPFGISNDIRRGQAIHARFLCLCFMFVICRVSSRFSRKYGDGGVSILCFPWRGCVNVLGVVVAVQRMRAQISDLRMGKQPGEETISVHGHSTM